MGADDDDVFVIGSGFGGSVTAPRLTEKGYEIAAAEPRHPVVPAGAAGELRRRTVEPR